SGQHVEIFGRQTGFQELDVRWNVIDDKDTRGHRNGTPYPIKRRTVSMNLPTEIGLDKYASQPPSRMRSSSPFMAKAVTATTGIERSSGSSLIQRVTSRPDTCGSWMSIRIRSGRILRTRSSASCPLLVPEVWEPCA